MADFPSKNIPPISYTTFGDLSSPYGGMRGCGIIPIPATVAWPAANLAIYIPMHIHTGTVVRRVFWANGSSTTGTGAFGIYTRSGSQVYATASTAKAGASALQYITPTAFFLPAGEYYFAVVMSATTNAMLGSLSITASIGRMIGLMQEALGGTTLPATMTPAQFANTGYPLCGITRLEA